MKNGAALKSLGEKSCEIKGGGQEMAAMMLMLKMFSNGCVHPGFLRLHHFFAAWLFLCGFHFFLYFIRPQNQPMADF